MKRGRPLQADPEKVRAFAERGRGKLARKGKLKAGVPKSRPPIPDDMRRRVMARSDFACCVCRQARVRLDIHHILPVQRYPDLVLCEANMMALCRPCHERHETAFRRVAWHELPRCVFAVARRDKDGGWAYLARTYPR